MKKKDKKVSLDTLKNDLINNYEKENDILKNNLIDSQLKLERIWKIFLYLVFCTVLMSSLFIFILYSLNTEDITPFAKKYCEYQNKDFLEVEIINDSLIKIECSNTIKICIDQFYALYQGNTFVDICEYQQYSSDLKCKYIENRNSDNYDIIYVERHYKC